MMILGIKPNTDHIQKLRTERRRKHQMKAAFCHPDDVKLKIVRVHTADGIRVAMKICGRLVYDPTMEGRKV